MTENLKRLVRDFRPQLSDWPILLKGAALILGFAWFFYHSLAAAIVLSPLILPFYVKEKKDLAKKRSRELGIQFRDAIMSVSTNQRAGYSVENAFAEAVGDMSMLYGKGSLIVKELTRIVKGLKNNITLEKLLESTEGSNNK